MTQPPEAGSPSPGAGDAFPATIVSTGAAGDLVRHALDLPGVWLDHPFGPDVDVLKVGPRDAEAKVFGIVSDALVTLKLPPDDSVELRAAYRDVVVPGYHVNKKHWSSIRLNAVGPAPEPDELVELIELARLTTRVGLPRRIRPPA